jgi:hypothetical protein
MAHLTHPQYVHFQLLSRTLLILTLVVLIVGIEAIPAAGLV